MQLSLDHGNGFKCDRCNKILYSGDVIKLSTLVLSKDKKKAYTGHYITAGKVDICADCYKYLNDNFVKFNPPRNKPENFIQV